jgi:hypothetical protein
VIGVFFTWPTGTQGRDHAERLAKQTYEYQRQLAEDARTQERLGEAYLNLLEMVEQVGAWAQAVRPVVDTDPPRPVPDLPDVREQIRVEAASNAFASAAVREALGAWRRVVRDVEHAVLLIDLERDAGVRGERLHAQLQSPWLKLQELRPAEVRARRDLIERVADELGHRLLEPRPDLAPMELEAGSLPVTSDDQVQDKRLEDPTEDAADQGHAGGMRTEPHEK